MKRADSILGMRRLLLLLLLVPAVPALAQTPEVAVAVLDVQGLGNVSDERVRGLSSLLASEVNRYPNTRVVRSAEIRALLGFEAEKQMMGCATDGACLAEIGGALGVDYLVQSEVAWIGDRWVMSVTVLHAGRAESVGRATRSVDTEGELVDAIPEMVEEATADAPGLGRASKASTRRWVGTGISAAVLVGGGVVYGLGRWTFQKYKQDPVSVSREQRSVASLEMGLGIGLVVTGAAGLVASWLLPGADQQGAQAFLVVPPGGGAIVGVQVPLGGDL